MHLTMVAHTEARMIEISKLQNLQKNVKTSAYFVFIEQNNPNNRKKDQLWWITSFY